MKVLTLLASGFEDLEALGTVALLRRANLTVSLCSVENNEQVIGKYGINIKADLKLKDLNESDYDVLFLPGGMPGVDNLAKEAMVNELIKSFMKEDKVVAAICAAPSLIGKVGLLKERKFTCFPSFENYGANGIYLDKQVVVDGNLITGKAAGSVIEFAAAIIDTVTNEKNDVLEEIYFN